MSEVWWINRPRTKAELNEKGIRLRKEPGGNDDDDDDEDYDDKHWEKRFPMIRL